MAVAKEIRGKIRSIKNTQKITRAMEMVAASKMRRAQERMQHARPYADKIAQVVGHLSLAHPEYTHPFLQTREVKRVGFIVVTTDRGLCGGLNTLLLRSAIAAMRDWHDKSVSIQLALVGRKAEGFFRRVGGHVLAQQTHLGDAPTAHDLTGIVKTMLDAGKSTDEAKRIDALYLCSNKFVNTMSQQAVIQQILPIMPQTTGRMPNHWDYLYEPDNANEVLDRFLCRYIESQVYRAVIENIACEQAARMIAMKNATENAADLIHQLERAYHKARQAAITQELSEIVAGAAAV